MESLRGGNEGILRRREEPPRRKDAKGRRREDISSELFSPFGPSWASLRFGGSSTSPPPNPGRFHPPIPRRMTGHGRTPPAHGATPMSALTSAGTAELKPVTVP